jgi:diaminopropionate ammonia-lyase
MTAEPADAPVGQWPSDPPDVLVNPRALARLPGVARASAPLAVHRRLPGYAPTPLVSSPAMAAGLGVGELWIKDESSRLGLPAFKILGASYACYRALAARLGQEPSWESVAELAAALAPVRPLTLCTATDGNHGRAVARVARLLGLESVVYMPAGSAQARIDGIVSEGATVTVVAGGYDEAVARSAEDAGDDCLLVSDTSWPGYEEIPAWVIDGYSTVFAEVSDELAASGRGEPDVVVVPIGVGALAAAAVVHYKAETVADNTALLGVEPVSARCVTESIRAGRPISLPFPQTSIMAGLNCGTPSLVAWPLMERGLDAMVAVSDGWAAAAMVSLADAGLVVGETGSSALAGLRAVMMDQAGGPVRTALGLGRASSVLVLCTEGATDPAAWQQIVGSEHRPDVWHG